MATRSSSSTVVRAPGAVARSDAERRPDHGRGRGWPAIGLGLVLAALKAAAFGRLFEHRATFIAFAALAGGTALLKGRPMTLAVFMGVLVPVALAPALGLGVVIGVATFAVLATLFVAVATVMQWHDDQTAR